MVNGAFNFIANPLNFTLQQRNPRLQFVHGKGVQILLYEQDQRIIRSAREEIIKVHAPALRDASKVSSRPMSQSAFKIFTADQWAAFQRNDVFHGAPVDLADGYIHLSTAAQLDETLAKHFAGQSDLVIAEVRLDGLGDALKWEVSRGGALFPHLYAPLRMENVLNHSSR